MLKILFFFVPFFLGWVLVLGGIPSFSFGSSQSDGSWGMACSCCSDSTWLVVVPWRFSLGRPRPRGKTTVAMGAAAGESLQTIAVKSSNKLQSNRRTQVLTSNKCRIDLHLNKICQKLTICWYTWSFNFLLRRMLQIHILFAGWLNMIQNSGKFTSIPSAQGPNIVDGLLKMHGISTSKNATKQSTKKFNGCTHSSRLLHPKNKPLRGPLRARR